MYNMSPVSGPTLRPLDCSESSMENCTPARWSVSEMGCALCDSERHLAHVVAVQGLWHAYNATRLNSDSTDLLMIGSFARMSTAMEAVESDLADFVAANAAVVERPVEALPAHQPRMSLVRPHGIKCNGGASDLHEPITVSPAGAHGARARAIRMRRTPE